jgi:hypothetical protein
MSPYENRSLEDPVHVTRHRPYGLEQFLKIGMLSSAQRLRRQDFRQSIWEIAVMRIAVAEHHF